MIVENFSTQLGPPRAGMCNYHQLTQHNKGNTMDFSRTLTTVDPTDLLEAFIHKFNGVIEESDEQAHQINTINSQLAGYIRQCHAQFKEITQLKSDNAQHETALTEADDIAKKALGMNDEIRRLKMQLTTAQEQLKRYKGEGDPARLKKQIKRQKESAAENKKRIKSLENTIKKERTEHKKAQTTIDLAANKIAELKRQLAHDTGSGLYHNGEHHLIIWPEKTKMQDSEGSIFEGRSLLYLHQSGRGGLIAYNQETNQVNMCAAPRGGLRPSLECREFAKDWLYKINEIQEGTIKDEDMIPVNYNGKDF